MAYPKEYDPQQGYMYQLFVKTPHQKALEHLDYAEDRADMKHLMKEYRMVYSSYGAGYSLKAQLLPQKYWKK